MKSREYLTKSCMVYFKVKFALNSIANVINNRFLILLFYYFFVKGLIHIKLNYFVN